MQKIVHTTEKISESNVTLIRSKGCYRVRVFNRSTGTIFVDGCPIENKQEMDFIVPGCVFDRDFEMNIDDTVSFVEVYVTRFLDPAC